MAQTTSFDLKAFSFSILILLTTYTTYLSGLPPNPTPYNSTQPDSLRSFVSPSAIIIRRCYIISLGLFHAYLSLTYPTPSSYICPKPSNLNPKLFTWNLFSLLCFTLILLGSYIRLSAFSALGSDFTFRLAAPKKLVTSGLYKYIQHPSYTGKALIILGNMMMLQNPGASKGCWLPEWVANAVWFWSGLAVFGVLAVGRIGWRRVKDEERMLKDTFGEEWVRWHVKTWRLVPGLF